MSGSDLRIAPADSGRSREDFIRLPERLYAGHPGFVAPLRMERRMALSPKHNPWFEHGQAQLWIAYRGGRPAGRISAQVDSLHLERHGDATGHFGFLDAEDDAELFARLTGTAEEWLRGRGMRRAVGPLNLSINEEVGLLVDGFASRPMLMMGYSPPYADGRLAALGFAKVRDVLAYDYDLTRDISAQTAARMKRARASPEIEVRPIDLANYRRELALIIDVFNDAWSQNWGFIPFTHAEMEAVAKAMKPLVKADLVSIAAVRGGLPAAMMVTLPNLTEAITGLHGRLLPFGWARLLWRLKLAPPRSGRVLLMGVRRQYHGTPYGAALMLAMFDAFVEGMRKHDMRFAELSWILEDNTAMRAVLEGIGARVYKTYRIYEKSLA